MKKPILSCFYALLISTMILIGGCTDNGDDEPQPPVVEDPVLTVDETPIAATAAAADYTIEVESNGKWTAKAEYTVEPETGWITLEGTPGENDGTITVKVAANSATETRGAEIVITMGDLTKTVSLTQDAADLIFEIDTTEINDVETAGGTFTVNVTSNHTWAATEESDFVSLTDAEGSGNGQFTITIDSNTDDVTARTATVTVTPAGGAARTITISQQAIPVVLDFDGLVEPVEFTADGGDIEVNIVANIGWSISSSETFATVDTESGTGDGTVTITVTANDVTEVRTAIITLSAVGVDGVEPVTFTISQEAAIPSVTVNGVKWATSNLIDAGTFGAAVNAQGCFFQFNSKVAFAATGEIANPEQWRMTNPAQGGDWATENDPCPEGWRVPTSAEFSSLPSSSSGRREVTTSNFGEKLGYWFGEDPVALANATFEDPKGCLFLPRTGGYRGDDLNNPNISGQLNRDGWYWSSTSGTGYTPNVGSSYRWTNNTPGNNNQSKQRGFAVRCVKAE